MKPSETSRFAALNGRRWRATRVASFVFRTIHESGEEVGVNMAIRLAIYKVVQRP